VFSNLWPTGVPNYMADTHVTDRTTILDHRAIASGVGREVAKIQHNINTTNLFVSGWLFPVKRGWIDNLDVNNLYVHNLHSDTLTIHDLDEEHIDVVSFKPVNSDFNVTESAFRNFDIPIDKAFEADNTFFLNSSGFYFNGLGISGNVFAYDLLSGSPSSFRDLQVEDLFTMSGGVISLPDTINHRIMIEGISSVVMSGQMTEGRLYYHSYGGHDHKDNKIGAEDIFDNDITYTDDLQINSNSADINVLDGQIDVDNFNVKIDNFNSTNFQEVGNTQNAYYADVSGSQHFGVLVSGAASDLDLGAFGMTSHSGYLYAVTSNLPSIATSTASGAIYIFRTRDLHKWEAHLMKGLTSTYDTGPSGIVVSNNIVTYEDDVFMCANNSKFGAGYKMQGFSDRNEFGSSSERFSVVGGNQHVIGMTVTDNNMYVYGRRNKEERPAFELRWDSFYLERHNSSALSFNSSGQITPSGTVFEYQPLLTCFA